MRLVLVRHGETTNNFFRLYNTETEDLNDTGIKQAKSLKNKIKKIDYDIVISSPLLRTRHTTNIINTKNRQVIFDDRIKERNHGRLSGIPLDSIDRTEYWNYYSSNRYGESESVQELFNRVFDFIDELKHKEYNSVLIVTHSGVSKAFSAYFEGIKDGKFLNRGLKNCEIKEYDI